MTDSAEDSTSGGSIRISVIVPVHQHAAELVECLAALRAACGPGSEIIVVDDASTDDSSGVATRMGARVFRLSENSGPAAARNYGARRARGAVLLFVDADVVVAPGAVDRVARVLEQNPDVSAVFGSYDARPKARGVVSQYRNLLHHFVHQNGSPEASTFWAGCGAIRRSVFEVMEGFDEKRFPRPSIEDIELGYRLRKAGHRILLDKALQGTHLKRWTLAGVMRTDVVCHALPWARLILESGSAARDLNLSLGQRLSVALVWLGSASLLLAPVRTELLILGVAAILAVVTLNHQLFTFFVRQRGFLFAAACVPLHLLYYLYGGLGYLYGWIGFHLRRIAAGPGEAVPRGRGQTG